MSDDDIIDTDTYPGVFGPVNSCCGVTASVGHGLYCDFGEAEK